MILQRTVDDMWQHCTDFRVASTDFGKEKNLELA